LICVFCFSNEEHVVTTGQVPIYSRQFSIVFNSIQTTINSAMTQFSIDMAQPERIGVLATQAKPHKGARRG
jgi:hypothetical protein